MRNTGRTVKEGEQPMKMVKVRAGTVNRMRELEVLKDELKVAGQDAATNGEGSSAAAGGEIMQGLYAYSQTEQYVPAPVVEVSFFVTLPRTPKLNGCSMCRARSRRITLAISTFTCHLCCPEELLIYLVSPFHLSRVFRLPRVIVIICYSQRCC
jgi:hypothetical protein